MMPRGLRGETRGATYRKGNPQMTVSFEIVRYKAMDGYYIRASWPNGQSQNIEDNSTDGPAFSTEAEAQAWIDNESAVWLQRHQISN
jgi:hypothetical protein